MDNSRREIRDRLHLVCCTLDKSCRTLEYFAIKLEKSIGTGRKHAVNEAMFQKIAELEELAAEADRLEHETRKEILVLFAAKHKIK
jgi:hypothetical protein